jgi:hypothetical protein
MAKTAERMTPLDYAAYRGVSKQIVNRHIKAGRLPKKGKDGKLDVAKADDAWSKNVRINLSNAKHAAASGGKPSAGGRDDDDEYLKDGAEPTRNAVALARGEQTDGPVTIMDAQFAHELIKIDERRTKLEALQGKLISREAAKARFFEVSRRFRDDLMDWVTPTAETMAAELSKALGVAVDPHLVHAQLDRHARTYLDRAARTKPELD